MSWMKGPRAYAILKRTIPRDCQTTIDCQGHIYDNIFLVISARLIEAKEVALLNHKPAVKDAARKTK